MLQDSFLGPLLFVMFINDLPEHVHTQVDMLAGDTTFLAAFDFGHLEDLWNTPTSMRNKLLLNCSKTKTILIDCQRLGKRLNNEEFWFDFVRLDTPGKHLNNEDRKLEIQLKGCNLEQAINVKLFGLDIDEQLSFDVHINCLSKKILKRIGIRNRIKAYLPRTERLFYNNSLIKPLILYCKVTWISCCSQDNIDKIFKLQNCCARIIRDAPKTHSSVDLFNTLGWMRYDVEFDIKRCLIAYKRISGACPDYINDLFGLNSSQHSRNTRRRQS